MLNRLHGLVIRQVKVCMLYASPVSDSDEGTFNFEYHLRTRHPLLYNCIAVNRFVRFKKGDKKAELSAEMMNNYNHVLYSIPCECGHRLCLKKA